MKLHLPKMLLTAVLAAVTLAPAAWGGQWVANGNGNEDCYTFTGENDATSLDTTGHIFNNAVWVRAGANELSPTLDELLLGNGAKLNITGTWKNTVNEFTLLTISSLKIGADGAGTGSLEIAGNANNGGVDIPLQTIKISSISGTLNGISVLKNGKLQMTSDLIREKVADGTTISVDGGTLELTRKDNKNINKSITVKNNGTLTLCSTDIVDEGATTTFTINASTMAVGGSRIALGENNKIILVGGTITGDGDVHGALDYSGSATLQSSGTSSIAGAIRLRSVNLTLDVTDTLTVANIVQANNHTGGIIKDGTGTLVIQALQAKTGNNNASGSVYKGNTEIKNGTIKYDLADDATYTGTIFGAGNITKAGTASLTLAKIQNLDGDIDVEKGSLSITALEANKTLDIDVAQGAALNIGSVVVNEVTHQLTEVEGVDDKVWFTNDGSTESADGNGFRVREGAYVLFKGYAWDGSVTGFTVDNSSGDTILTSQGTAGTVYYVNTGNVNTNAVSGATGFRVYSLDGQDAGNLIISGDVGTGDEAISSKDLLLTTEGNGNITLATNVSLASGDATVATGTLTIKDVTLTMGQHKSDNVKIDKFNSINLDGGTIDIKASTTSFQNVTVDANKNGYIKVRDMPDNFTTTAHQLTGTTSIGKNGTLTIETSEWRQFTNIALLTGEGALVVKDTNTSTNVEDTTRVDIASLQGYTGSIEVNAGSDGVTTLNATTGGTVSLKGLTLANGATGNITTTGKVGLGNVSLTEGSTLSILNSGEPRTTTITSLSVTGSATVGTVRHSSCHNGTFDISSLSNTGDSATLTLKNGSQIDTATVFNLSGTSSMKGTINVQSDSYRGDNNDDENKLNMSRKLQVNLNSTAVAANAVINFQDASDTSGKNGSGTANNVRANYNILGVGVEGAKVAGLSGTTTNAATVKSTDSTARTLELAVASGSYTTNATIDATVKLKKTGAGTQTLTGTVSSKDITVGAGELILSNEITVEKLAMTGGVLTVGTYTGEELTTENTLTVTSSASFGAGAKVNANLVLSNNTQLTLDGALTMGSTLTLGEEITLSGSLVAGLNDLEEGQSIALFSGVDSLTLGTAPATTDVITLDNGIKANGYFTGLADDLMLTYTGGENASLSITKMVSPVTPSVPEPTTATLSLLALAGLAARRRRK